MKKRERIFKSSFSETGRKRSFYLMYTGIFLVVSFFAFSWFIFSDRSLIWKNDGWSQHYKALLYYGNYLRTIAKNLIKEHRLIIPDWDFHFGEGNDVVNTLHYYVVGDPLALLSVLVPVRYMHWFYSACCILRLYLAGLAFSALAFGTGVKNRYGILAGMLSYCFCFWALLGATRHPYFLNPMIYLPLLILGIEKILRKERPYLFIGTVTISAASNFYFFYMIVIAVVIYVLVRVITLYDGKVKDCAAAVLKIGLMSVIGVCMAGIIFLPVVMIFLHDSRISVERAFHAFYPLAYYSQLPSLFLSTERPYWLCMGFSAPVILALFLLFRKRREDGILKLLFLICTAVILFPIGGRIFNGMSYMSNRWNWIFALLCTYILARKWEELLTLGSKDRTVLFLCSTAYYLVCLLFDKSRNIAVFAMLPLLFITLMISGGLPRIMTDLRNRQMAVCLIVIISAVNLGFWKFAPNTENYVSEFKENGNILEDFKKNEANAVGTVAGPEYTRYTGKSLGHNVAMFSNLSTTEYFWTLSHPYLNSFRTDLEMREQSFFNYQGYDDRTAPIALSSVQYYVKKSGDSGKLPYGYEQQPESVNVQSEATLNHLEELKKELGTEELSDAQTAKINNVSNVVYDVYKNDLALPLGYCYSSYIDQEKWESLDAVQKQEVQLEAAYIREKTPELQQYDQEISEYQIPVEITCSGSEVTYTEDGFVTTAGNTTVTLSFEGIANAETYVGISGLDFVQTPEYQLYFGDRTVDPGDLYNQTDWNMLSSSKKISVRREKIYWNETNQIELSLNSSAGTSKKLDYELADSQYSSGRHDFLINMGYTEEPMTSVKLTLPERGIYSIDDIRIYAVPMDHYAEKIEQLRQNSLQEIALGTDSVTGTISLDDTKLLCLSVPYSAGWKVFVDGEENEVLLTNGRHLGVILPEGEHTVSFRYSSPYKRIGFVISVGGFIAFLALILYNERKNRKRVTARA